MISWLITDFLTLIVIYILMVRNTYLSEKRWRTFMEKSYGPIDWDEESIFKVSLTLGFRKRHGSIRNFKP